MKNAGKLAADIVRPLQDTQLQFSSLRDLGVLVVHRLGSVFPVFRFPLFEKPANRFLANLTL